MTDLQGKYVRTIGAGRPVRTPLLSLPYLSVSLLKGLPSLPSLAPFSVPRPFILPLPLPSSPSLVPQGLKDGYKTEACFNSPSGLALDRTRNVLYIADSLNDAIRAVSLDKSDLVTTIKPSNMAAAKKRDRELGAVREDLVRVLGEEGKVGTSRD